MPPCGNFSHDLLSLLGRSTFDGMKVVRCTIVALDPKNNTVDVELGEDPPTALYAGELRDTDCSSIPSFAGDGWSADEERRRFNDVPIFYHCQGSTGTVNELRTGHMAFRVPPIELTTPPFSAGTVAENHAVILREKVYMVYIPPTVAEAAGGSLGSRYVVGHSDINDISPCKSEYICLRLHDKYDDEYYIDEYLTDNPFLGHSTPGETVVSIFDPIGNRVYKGLEQFGINFPCLASDIINKVASITIDENTPEEDINFLDTLFEITPLYQNAFIYDLYTFYTSHTVDIYCHEYLPTKLCWLTGYFDYYLQLEDKVDKSTLVFNYRDCFVTHTSGGSIPVNFTLSSYGDTSWDYPYKQTIDYVILKPGLSNIYQIETSSYTITEYLYNVPSATLVGTRTNHGSYDTNEYVFNNWRLVDPYNEETGFFSSGRDWQQGPFFAITGQATRNTSTNAISGSYEVKCYPPWEHVAFYTLSEIAITNMSTPLSAYPYINGSAIIIGRKGTYGLSTIAFQEDQSASIFSYNQSCWYGTYDDRHISLFTTLPGASAHLKTMIDQMMTMFRAVNTGSRGKFSSFIIDVLEE